MTERERLIEMCENFILSCKSSLCDDCEHNQIDYPHCMGVHFADHLLSNGVIVPPVEIGQRVWYIHGGYYNAQYKEPRPIEVTEINKKWHGKVLDWGFIANGT